MTDFKISFFLRMGTVENSEEFCLKWNDFQSNMTSSFAQIREENDLLDVTIMCEGQTVKAHKLVLSASSDAFRQVFKSSELKKNPLIFMWDIKISDFKLLLDFMYEGQVNVVQDNLNSFLALAERLKVKGLTTNNNILKRTSLEDTASKRPRISTSSTEDQPVNIKQEPQPQTHVYNANLNSHLNSQGFNYDYNYENGGQQNPQPQQESLQQQQTHPVTTNPGVPTFVASNTNANANHMIGTPEDFALNTTPPQTALVDHQKGEDF